MEVEVEVLLKGMEKALGLEWSGVECGKLQWVRDGMVWC